MLACPRWRVASYRQSIRLMSVFGSFADILKADVRFTPQRKHAVATSARPLSAKSALTALQQKSAPISAMAWISDSVDLRSL
jgi:hypothetical protein